MKRALLYLGKYLGLFALFRRWTQSGVRILCYHGVWRGAEGWAGDAMFMPAESFALHMDRLAGLGYPVIPLETAIPYLRGDGLLPPCPVVITIDDGWYSFYADMLPILQRHEFPATLYVDSGNLGRFGPVPHVMARYRALLTGLGYPDLPDAAYTQTKCFDYMSPDDLAQAHSQGLSIELHSHGHSLHDFSEAAIRDEITANRRWLGRWLGRPGQSFKHFCYPSGHYDAAAGPILAALSISSATTTEAGIAYPGNSPYFLPRILDGAQMSLIEFEAELAGIGDFLRQCRRLMRRFRAI